MTALALIAADRGLEAGTGRGTWQGGHNHPRMSSRGRVFWLELIYGLALLALAVVHLRWTWLRDWLPDLIGGVPLAILWYGALGGVMISFTGVTKHKADWDPDYQLRHIARPFTGAVVALAAYLMLRAGLYVASQGAGTAPVTYFYLAVAFVVGYRDEVFRDMVKRVADGLLAPLRPHGQGNADRRDPSKS